MNFAWPQLLWLLAAPAALLARELASKRRLGSAAHPKILRAEAGVRSLTLAGPAAADFSSDGAKKSRGAGAKPRWWLCAGIALAIVALARPQWGRIEEPVFNQSREIVLALDLSRSMLTPDVKPSRLERAKLLIQSLLGRLAGERLGLVVFSGTAFLQSPLSLDYEMLREFLPSLGPDFMPVGGTNYGALIDTAADAFADHSTAGRFLIILSDGGATDDHWRDHVAKLKAKGIRVISLGVGTAAGGFIPDPNGGFMKDERGAVVLAKLESATLQELADKTGGVYRDAGEWVDLPALLQATIEAGRKGQFLDKKTVRYVERYQWVLAPALLCLLMSFWREFPVRPRPREMMLKKALRAGAVILVFTLGLAPAAFAVADGADASALLGRIVGRLSAQNSSNALDWAELGQQTLTWGQQLRSAHQAVAPGPVRDALAAVDIGSAIDPKAADWRRLRTDLATLLKTPEDQKQKPPPPQNQGQNHQPQPNQPSSPTAPQQSNQGHQPQSAPRPESSPFTPAAKPSPSGDGGPSPRPPAAPPPTQEIGGSSLRRSADPAGSDPALAVPLQKLDELRNQDSPAELFGMIENNEPRPPADGKGKDW